MMVYLSTDMEGTAGIVDWSQCMGDEPAAAESWLELGKPSAKRSPGSSAAKKGPTKADLLAEARRHNIAGRSTMTRPQLKRVLNPR